jgi:ubiquinone/menaquinone biosynthesis C-methylase UbiE
MNIFFGVHQGLPREAPGDAHSTVRALAAMVDLPAVPSILDIGCGPGAQTIALACHSPAQITAVDRHQPFLDELARRAEKAGVSERIRTINASMFDLRFPETFDVIWSEGAIYIVGFEEGLRAWRPLLRRGGYVAVTELSWIKPNPPQQVVDNWARDYPGMASIERNLSRVRAAGYQDVEHFTLPESSWWEPYYLPMQARVEELREKYRGNAEAQEQLDIELVEIEMYRKYSAWYGYVFYVMRAAEENV